MTHVCHDLVSVIYVALPYSICAGRYLAEGSLFTAVVRMLAVFTVSPEKDAQGRVVEPEIKFVTHTSRFVVFGSVTP